MWERKANLATSCSTMLLDCAIDSFNVGQVFVCAFALLVNCVVMLAILGVRKLGPAWLMWLHNGAHSM